MGSNPVGLPRSCHNWSFHLIKPETFAVKPYPLRYSMLQRSLIVVATYTQTFAIHSHELSTRFVRQLERVEPFYCILTLAFRGTSLSILQQSIPCQTLVLCFPQMYSLIPRLPGLGQFPEQQQPPIHQLLNQSCLRLTIFYGWVLETLA